MASTIGYDDVTRAVEGQTVTSLFARMATERGDRPAIRWKEPDDTWAQWTWADYAQHACRIAAGLGELGVGRGDRVVLMLRNRPEFHAADAGALLAGATPISIYNSSAPEQVEYLVKHCEAAVAVVDDVDFLERFLKVRGELPALRHLVVVDNPHDMGPDDVLSWPALLDRSPVDLEKAAAAADPDDLLTVIYTSGTTGPPKGVMLSHLNACWTSESLRLAFEMDVTGMRLVSYLPMAHIAERMTSHYSAMRNGYEVTTCPDPSQVAPYLREIRPQIVFGVPRVWEKLHAGIMAAAGADPDKRAQLERALEVGKQVAAGRATGRPLSSELQSAWEQVDAAAFANLRRMVGLDAVEAAITGAAPIPVGVLEFFRAIGVPMSEIYGMSENTGPMTWDALQVKLGTVGRAVPGTEVKLLDDGEVCCRGGHVFRGYLEDPEKTAEVLDDEGWLHSGDIGVVDDEGYLRIVDRKKEIIITAGGKNISPANVEGALKSFPLIGQACVVGDKRPFVVALVVLDPEVAPAWARSKGVDAGTVAELAEHPEVRAEIGRNVAEANSRFNNVEQVKKFMVIGEEWLPDSDELTPTMKLKRRGVHAKYAEEIEALYRG